MSIEKIIENLKQGNLEHSKRYLNEKEIQVPSIKKQEELVNTQSPEVAILSCADSRVTPEFIFNKGLGELFVVRVAGNVASTEAIASLEYAVSQLNTKVILVLGHQNCGAVQAATQKNNLSKNLNALLNHIKPEIKDNAKHSAQMLIQNSEIISEKVKNEEIKIVPAYYNLKTGLVEFLD